MRQGRFDLVLAERHERVDITYAAGSNTDQHLAFVRRRCFNIFELVAFKRFQRFSDDSFQGRYLTFLVASALLTADQIRLALL